MFTPVNSCLRIQDKVEKHQYITDSNQQRDQRASGIHYRFTMPLHETQSHFLQIEQPTEDVERNLRTFIFKKLGIEHKIEIGNVHRFGKRQVTTIDRDR
jgi:hypothetical protein